MMLQPRLWSKSERCGTKMETRNFQRFGRIAAWAACLAIIFSVNLVSCQDLNLNPESIEVSRVKRDSSEENRDLTVLLVNDQKRPGDVQHKVGRYHSVKPLIGLLTSTARTFIQDGVTTEFATQILGTTLDNGRIYAQLLTKSSLVLYNNPSRIDNDELVKPTRIPTAFDNQWNVKQDLGFIDPGKFVLKNTDYIAPSSRMDIVYASKAEDNLRNWSPPSSPDNYYDNRIEEPTGRRVQPVNEIPRYKQNEIYNMLDGPDIEIDKKMIVNPTILNDVNNLHRHSKVPESLPNVTPETKEQFNDTHVVKVKPNYDLPTFTIKNEFSPIFYYIDNVESRSSVNQASFQTKLPKRLFGQKSEPKPKKTFTYAGFADFTTVVGDTVIVFSPNTDLNRVNNPNEVNVYPSARPIDKMASKITHLAADIPFAKSTYKAHEVLKPSRVIQMPKPINQVLQPSKDDNRSEKALYNDRESLEKVLYEDNKMPDAINVQYNNGFDLNLDVIQPSEAVVTTTENTRLTDDLGILPENGLSSIATDPLGNLKPSATILESAKKSVINENENSDLSASQEEIENTATESESEEVVTTENDDDYTTTESPSTTDDYDSKEEDDQPTTETTPEKEVVCTKGFNTQSVMTTAYKTLTYLTTYFIPLEGTELTSSIKSSVVVESNVGYSTNINCKTDTDIEPTAVVSVDIRSSIHSNIEAPTSQNPKIEDVTESQTEKDLKTTTTEKTVKDNVETPTKEENNESTTELIPLTTKESVEVSVSSEESSYSSTSTTTASTTTTTEKPIEENEDKSEVNINNTNENKEKESDNEVDVIYKTLYTTYTYLTTFFGESATSVASHKSVVTNVITATVNLSEMDPELLGAFNEDDIAPTNVGIGRPTEAIHSIIDLVKNKDVLESVEDNQAYSEQTPTPALGDDVAASIKPDGVKTYFTTYTFFTTIYVGTDANVCSRSEIYTNYVGPGEIVPTKVSSLGNENTRAQFDFRNCKQIKQIEEPNNAETSSVESSVRMLENDAKSSEEVKKEAVSNPTPVEVDMLFSVESNPLESDSSYVTDVKSSSSRGEKKLIENNNIYDDQSFSESNIDEITPSPTLLLQTSYTTFTYYTTMYIGKDSSKVKSRLETITNLVTETIQPKKKVEEEENVLPITYYTTFTYWTTLYKDKQTTITSREEVVSNVVTPTTPETPTVNPIDTTPIDVDTVLPPRELEIEIKPSLVDDPLAPEDGKATFYTTYTYFTTFYVGNTSQIRSSLETVTNIVDSTKLVDDNRLGRKVQSGPDKNLIQDEDKPKILPSIIKEEISPTKLPDISAAPPTVLLGTYIDNLFELKSGDDEKSSTTPSPDKKILYSQVAVISGDSTVVTNANESTKNDSNTAATTNNLSSTTANVIESSEGEVETTTENKPEIDDEEEDDESPRKKSRLSFTSKKPTFTPVIRPFASRNRPTFNPKRVPLIGSATTIRLDFTPTITATPSLKSARPAGFGSNRKASAFSGSSSRRFSGRSSISNLASANIPSPSRAGSFARNSIQPTSRRTGFRSSSLRNNVVDLSSRSAIPRIRPTASVRLRGGRQSAVVTPAPVEEQIESETTASQQDVSTESVEEVTESVRTSSNPLIRFRRPISRQPGASITPRSTTQASARKTTPARGRITTTTRKTTTRTTTNPILSLRRQRPNALFPRRNLFNKPEPEVEENKENEQEVENESQNVSEGEDLEADNDFESSDRKEQQVATPSTPPPTKSSNSIKIRPFAFKRRSKRQADYGSRRYSNFRRPNAKALTQRPEPEPEPETEAPVTQRIRPGNRYTPRPTGRSTPSSTISKSSSRTPFIVRGSSTTATPAYRGRRPLPRTTTSSSKPKPPRLQTYNSQSNTRSNARSSSSRSRTRGSTRANSRQRNSYENNSGERLTHNHIVNDGKITVTHHIPVEVTIPVVMGKITEYKNILTAKPSLEVIMLNQLATSLGPLGNQQLLLPSEATELADNGATRIVKFLLHETPTTAIEFTPTTIRGRRTSYSHILPSTIYNVERITSTLTPEINANVPLANLLLSQLLLGNQQPAVNPLLALQGQGLYPQQPVVPTPVTEYKTRTTTYVTTLKDDRETVLTITFRGTPIETTIRDPTMNVITATEYITDTIVSTPTPVAQPNQQFNSLLLPLLLQQQQQQQAALALQTANPLLGLAQMDLSNAVQNNLLNNDIYSNSPKDNVLTDYPSNEEYTDESESVEDLPPPPPKLSRPKNKPKPPKPAPAKLTSVVTLYVSGRTPGEFSTVLSTVVSDDTQTVRKREAIYYDDVYVLPSILPSLKELTSSQYDAFDAILENSVLTDLNADVASQDISNFETQSLESIVGELNKHISYDPSPTYAVKLVRPTKSKDSDRNSLDEVS